MHVIKNLIRALVLLSLTFNLGCEFIQDQGSSVGSKPQDPVDFSVAPPPEDTETNPTPDTPQSDDDIVRVPRDPNLGRELNFEGLDLIINSDDVYTSTTNVNLELIYPEFTFLKMKISMNATCLGGDWIEVAPFENKDLLNLNANNEVSVRFQDYDFSISQCVSSSILHDNKAPDILFTKYPMNTLEEGNTAQIIYSVTDASPISNVTCELNGIVKACPPGTQTVDITALPEGDYTFKVVATDVLGLTSSKQVSWSVVSLSKKITQNFLVNNFNKVDILIVIDNSGSMNYEQKSMASRVGSFLSILTGLDWQIGVTTTDPSSTKAVNTTETKYSSGLKPPTSSTSIYKHVSDGLFIPISGLPGQFYLNSTMHPADAQDKLGKTLQRPETGSGSEQAIYATYRSIERGFYSNDANPIQKNFFREGAHFASLVISDEDESANNAKNDPENLLKLVSDTFSGQKAFSWHSIITKPGDTACKSTHGATYGERYNALSLLTGGMIGSVCESDYGAQLAGIANEIRQLVKSMTLTCAPLQQFPIVVSKDGVVYSKSFVVDGVNLKFDSELDAGNYSVQYECLK